MINLFKKNKSLFLITSIILLIISVFFFIFVFSSPKGKTYKCSDINLCPNIIFKDTTMTLEYSEYTTNSYSYTLEDGEIKFNNGTTDEVLGKFLGYKIVDEDYTIYSTLGIILFILGIILFCISLPLFIILLIIIISEYNKNKNNKFRFKKFKH